MTDLHYLPVTQALAGFRAREPSPVELVTAVIERDMPRRRSAR
jgi:hypothetical protein